GGVAFGVGSDLGREPVDLAAYLGRVLVGFTPSLGGVLVGARPVLRDRLVGFAAYAVRVFVDLGAQFRGFRLSLAARRVRELLGLRTFFRRVLLGASSFLGGGLVRAFEDLGRVHPRVLGVLRALHPVGSLLQTLALFGETFLETVDAFEQARNEVVALHVGE